MLVDAAAIGDDQLVLVTGAAGMVGGFATQLARIRGARVVAAVREPDADEARRLGAEMVVGTGSELETVIRGQGGVDACIDTVGLGTRGVVCVRDGGAFVTSVPTAVPDGARGIAPQTVQVQPNAGALAELVGRVVAGELTVRVAEKLSFEAFHDAYARLERGGLRGKIVLTP
jgi:NADPH:quinone reductase-like Zn-dependent oxidoreductase